MLAALVVALLAERRQRDGLPVGIEHVGDPARDTLAGEAQLAQLVTERARMRHPEHVPLTLQARHDPLSSSLALRRESDVPLPHFIGELACPLHAHKYSEAAISCQADIAASLCRLNAH